MKAILKSFFSFIEKNSERKITLALIYIFFGVGCILFLAGYLFVDPTSRLNIFNINKNIILGIVSLLMGSILLLISPIALIKCSIHTKKKNFIGYFAGFNNLPEKPNLDSISIPNNYEMPKISKIDSTNKKNIIEKYSFWKQSIQERIDHNEATEIYLAILGSVPYTYICGTLFCDGHLPLIHLEHERAENRWKRLNPSNNPNPISLNYCYKDNYIKQACLNKTQQYNDVGLAISFTTEIKIESLPKIVKDSTIFIKPNVEYNFDLLNNEQEQSKIAKEITHFITQLKSSNTKKIHLFISAQASFIARLGTLYQKNMHGTIVIYQWDANTQQYIWSIEYNGENVIATDVE